MRGRRHHRACRLRSRREADGRRHPDQRVAAPGGAICTRSASRREPVVPRRRRASTGPDRRLGRGRLLRPHLPQRPRPRARGDRRARGLRAGPRELAERLAAIPDDEGEPLGDGRLTARGSLRGGEGRRAGPDRALRRPLWRAVGTVGGEGGSTRSRTTRARRRQPRPGRPSRSWPGRASPGRAEGAHLLDVAPTVLEALGMDTPAGVRGASLLAREPA